jgi:hypothetical protein
VPLLPYFGAHIWISTQGERLRMWPTLLVSLFTTVWGSLAGASTARVAMDALEGWPPDPARALRIALRRAWPIVLTGLYRAIFAVLGMIVLLIPGLYVLSVYALIPVLPVLEPSIGGWQALRRSATLTEGARLLAFGAYVAPYYFVAGATMMLKVLTARVMGPHVGRLFAELVGSSFVLASAPFIGAIQVRLYIELRMRKEAIDIEWAIASPSRSTAVVS